jgi:hypothetical protein
MLTFDFSLDPAAESRAGAASFTLRACAGCGVAAG